MRPLIRLVGRLLIISLLLSTAVVKIKVPVKFTEDFIKGYNHIRDQHASLKSILPNIKEVANPNKISLKAIYPTLLECLEHFKD